MALPVPPVRPMTIDEYVALPEDEDVRHELQEGILVMAASPDPHHQLCVFRLSRQLDDQLPDDLVVVPDVDVDLQLVPRDQPATVRRPDLVVVTRAALDRVRHEGGLLRARDAVLAVEIISPGSRRLDTVVKAAEYADAGVPHYWVVDRDDEITLTAHHLAGAFGYAADAPVAGAFDVEAPFPVRLELDRLT